MNDFELLERDVQCLARRVKRHAMAELELADSQHYRDRSIRATYSAGNATLGQLAQATGLSTQRVHQIVREGEGA